MAKKNTKLKLPRTGGPRTAAGKAKVMENLAPPWKKGQSGNPKGRPKGRNITEHFKHILNAPVSYMPHVSSLLEKMDLDPLKYTVGEAVAYLSIVDVLEGDTRKLEILLNRVEGGITQVLEQTINGKYSISDIANHIDASQKKGTK